MTKIEIELPEPTARAAREAGLLTPQSLERLLTDALRRRRAADALLGIADRVSRQFGEKTLIRDTSWSD